ncbi:MAG: hypothetical protein COT33_02030 [Candidatus Nealsonbacteria bacterium CG08_land_8_20_14_0_20_38_20]|uniref:30S ribosomal protein S21 n=1 Tax=Candidatus Nealsonbacteria bacterium CG08_land_8_20_14_0_20_38_20 TaxID=1974705 RepID=A0A2H0YME5_9BACT|nr:MAG: hypothetical protein COT33_02030 [Candidatus Nealsonbacteria bacterium CG08_land_8_20_14_0_20_38_20]
MPLEVKKRPRETSQSLVYRFTKSIKKSGILLRARETRFRERKKSKEIKKRAALRKQGRKKEYEKLRKMSKI